eukprot:767308-Hanusia_phi.AAC.1
MSVYSINAGPLSQPSTGTESEPGSAPASAASPNQPARPAAAAGHGPADSARGRAWHCGVRGYGMVEHGDMEQHETRTT